MGDGPSEGRPFPHWAFDVHELRAVIEDEGFESAEAFERACHIRPGRLDEYERNGWQPFMWEFRRMAMVLDMYMDDLFDAVYVSSDEG